MKTTCQGTQLNLHATLALFNKIAEFKMSPQPHSRLTEPTNLYEQGFKALEHTHVCM